MDVTEWITVKPCIGYAIHYLNPFGGYSTFSLPRDPREKRSFERTNSVHRKSKGVIKSITTRSWECQSGPLMKKDADKFWMLLESPEVYLETPDQEIIPVTVNTNDWQEYIARIDKRGPGAT